MTQPAELLGEFIRTFEASLDPRLWVTLIDEETAEFREAHAIYLRDRETALGIATKEKMAHLLKEAADVMYVTTAMNMLMEEREPLFLWLIPAEERAHWEMAILEANACLKMAASIFGASILTTAFERVHQSNMSKVGKDGKPVRRKGDGKILKGPNYKPPFLLDLVQ
jgi:hypothetical protein